MRKIKKIMFSRKNLRRDVGITLLFFLTAVSFVRAGNLDSPGSPASTMFTLNQIYIRLTTNGTATEGDHLFAPSVDPASSLHTLKEIYEAIPTVDPSKIKLNQSYLGVTGTLTPDGGTANAADLFSGKTANLSNDWNLDTGTLNLACNTNTFDGTDNKVLDAYDGGGDGNNRWCMKDSGNALAGEIFDGKIGWVDGQELTGTMPNIGQQNITPGTTDQDIQAGYHNGTGRVAGDADLVTQNIKSGINIFGVSGDSNVVNTGSGDATADLLFSGKKAWVDGSEITGSMPFAGAQVLTPGTIDQDITLGYHNGLGYVAGDADLVSGNIKSGANIFGITGDSNVVNTSSGDASAGNIFSGKKAWVDGSEVTGSMPDIGQQIITPGSTNQAITLGYHDGTGYALGDTDLAASNIRSGVNIFGVDGNSNVVDSASGDAIAGEIVSGKKAWVDGAEITGTLANIGQQIITPGTSNQTITLGYHNGTGYAAGDADLSSGNIRSGVNIFGVDGDSNVVNTSSGDTVAGNIFSGKIAWVDGLEITGSMPDIGQQIITPGSTNQAITLGYHDGTGYALGDTDLAASNIRSGVNIFGVDGNSNVVNTVSGDAVAGDIFSGKKAWVDGAEVTGIASIFTYGDDSASKVLTSATGSGTYNAANLTVGKVKSGTAFGVGLSGDYPSATYPLTGDTGATDATATEICNTNEAWTKSGSLLTGTLNPTAATIGVGNTYCGVAGTLLKNEYNGSAGNLVLDYASYPLTTTVPGFQGGVDDYNNNQTSGGYGVIPTGSYVSAWTDCAAGDNCGTNDATNADHKDNSTGLVWSKKLSSGGDDTQSWFWANNCVPPTLDTDCDATGEDACICVKNSVGSETGCEDLGDGHWRTPTQKELMQAYIDGSWGNLSSAGYFYWSATTYSFNTQYAWLVTLSYGNTSYTTKTNSASYRVRCVR